MNEKFTADEVFAMAERIEHDAARFYVRLAESAVGPLARKALLDLARMEQDHEQVFSGLRTALTGARLVDPGGRYTSLLAQMSLDVDSQLGLAFTGQEAVDEVIRKAIAFEKGTIVFFAGMKEMVGDPAGKASIDGILKEELGHIFALTGYFSPVYRPPVKGSPPVRNPLHGQADSH